MPSVYKEATYQEITRWLDTTEVEYVPNGKRAGTKSSERYDAYAVAKTVGEALQLGSKPEDLLNDFEKGLLKRTGGPKRDAPLDLMAIEDTTDLTECDLILARWGYHEGRQEHGGRGEWLKTHKGDAEQEQGNRQFKGMTPQELTNWKAKISEQFSKLRKVVIARKNGLRPADVKTTTTWAESGEMIGERLKANKEAAKILEDAKSEARKVSKEEVLSVLRLWNFKKNYDRPNVTPKGQEYVLSETLGLLRARDGRYMATLPTREYPQVVQLLCQFLKESRPEGVDFDWPFTSISVNSSYAAKVHRDQNNLGPSALKAIGNFTGGRLHYWPEDDRSTKVEELQDGDKLILDAKERTVIFDGCRGHAVEPYEGERFSLVFFIADGYKNTPKDVQELLEQAGINFPTEEAADRIKKLLPEPAGYGAHKPKQANATATAEKLAAPKLKVAFRPKGKAGKAPETPTSNTSMNKGAISSFFKKKEATPKRKRQRGSASCEPASSEKRAKTDSQSAPVAAAGDSAGSDMGSFIPGMVCTLRGFKPSEELNGKEVVCRRHEPKKNKWLVSATWLIGGTMKRVGPENLVPVNGVPQPTQKATLEVPKPTEAPLPAAAAGAPKLSAELPKPAEAPLPAPVAAAPKVSAELPKPAAPKGRPRKRSAPSNLRASTRPKTSEENPKQAEETAATKEVSEAQLGQKTSEENLKPMEETASAKEVTEAQPRPKTLEENLKPVEEIVVAKEVTEAQRPEAEKNAEELLLLASQVDVLEASEAPDKDVIEALADYFVSLRQDCKDPEKSVSAALNILAPATLVPEKMLAEAITAAFGPDAAPEKERSSNSSLADTALERRRASSSQSPALRIQDVAESVKAIRKEVLDCSASAEWAVVGRMAGLLKASRVDGRETRFVVQILLGSHRISHEVVHAAIARALTSWCS